MELKEIATGMETQETKDLELHINELASALEDESMVRKAKLPENVFKDFFVPALTGELKENDVTIMKYVEYAGSPYAEVDIIDDKGEVMFTCPPLYNRSAPKIDKPVLPYTDIAGTYELKKARFKNEADNYMSDVVVGVREDIVVEETSSEEKWKKILGKYTSNNEVKMDDNITVEQDDDLEDFIDYD